MNNSGLKNYNLKDTIAAVATFPSKSALGIIKISGRKALPALFRIFTPRRAKDIRKVNTYTLHYGWIVNNTGGFKRHGIHNRRAGDFRENKHFVDEVLVSVMRAPHTYTKEDIVEISSHGGNVVLNKILGLILKQGVRQALPGEFTYRALINGRIDLLQAESIRDIVNAKTEDAVSLAVRQLNGESSKRIAGLKEEIKKVFIETEALINFPDDVTGIPVAGIRKKLKDVARQADKIISGSEEAKILKEGVKCVICGRTNAGKSTLFNRLLNEERVIVSEIPGTTRDVIEEVITIKGIPLRIFDTAGILEPKDLVSRRAVEKSSDAFKDADLVILVFDGSRRLNKDDLFLLKKSKDKNTVIVINKNDLKQRIHMKEFEKSRCCKLKMSALKNTGLKKLEEAVSKSLHIGRIDRPDMIFLNQYQKDALKKVKDDIIEAYNLIEKGYTIDFLNLSLKNCLDNMDKVSGQTLPEDVMAGIFSDFCIGK